LFRRPDRAARWVAAAHARRAAAARLGVAQARRGPGREAGRARQDPPGRRERDRRGRGRPAASRRVRPARRRPPPHCGPGADVRPRLAGARMSLADVAGLWTAWLGPEWGPPAWTLVKDGVIILGIIIPIALCVAFLTLWERKLIGWMQIR